MNEKTAHSLPLVMAALEALPCFDVPLLDIKTWKSL
jgi:hypothetical protein